jgi:hypothetical protein
MTITMTTFFIEKRRSVCGVGVIQIDVGTSAVFIIMHTYPNFVQILYTSKLLKIILKFQNFCVKNCIEMLE